MTHERPRGRIGLLRWTAMLTGALVALTTGITTAAQAAPTDPRTVVTLSFDDSNADQMLAVDIMNQFGMKGTFYTTTAWVGSPGYLTVAQLNALEDSGHEIGGHSVNHPDMTTLTLAQAEQEACGGRDALLGWGINTVASFAYPFAAVNATAQQAVENCGFSSGRGLGDIATRFSCQSCDTAENLPPANPYYTRAPDQVSLDWTLADLQSSVVNAENGGGGWLELTFHQLCETGCDPTLTIKPSVFAAFVQWLSLRAATENTVVQTTGQAISGVVPPPPPPVQPTVTRIAGTDRYQTALEVSKQYAAGVPRVYVANGLDFPDALSAAPAAAKFGAPVLLTTQNALPAGVADRIRALNPAQIVVVGGPSVVSAAVVTQLQAIKPVVRLSGADRFATSRAVATNAFPTGATTAYIATGGNFPDALAAAPAAKHFNGPIILVPGTATSIDAATRQLLVTLGVTTVRIAGGPSVVSNGILSSVDAIPGVSVQRKSGVDRYATAAAINLDAFPSNEATVYLAAGGNFPDALVGAALAGVKDAPLYLSPVACLDRDAKSSITRLGATSVVLFGGVSVLSTNVANLNQCG